MQTTGYQFKGANPDYLAQAIAHEETKKKRGKAGFLQLKAPFTLVRIAPPFNLDKGLWEKGITEHIIFGYGSNKFIGRCTCIEKTFKGKDVFADQLQAYGKCPICQINEEYRQRFPALKKTLVWERENFYTNVFPVATLQADGRTMMPLNLETYGIEEYGPLIMCMPFAVRNAVLNAMASPGFNNLQIPPQHWAGEYILNPKDGHILQIQRKEGNKTTYEGQFWPDRHSLMYCVGESGQLAWKQVPDDGLIAMTSRLVDLEAYYGSWPSDERIAEVNELAVKYRDYLNGQIQYKQGNKAMVPDQTPDLPQQGVSAPIPQGAMMPQMPTTQSQTPTMQQQMPAIPQTPMAQPQMPQMPATSQPQTISQVPVPSTPATFPQTPAAPTTMMAPPTQPQSPLAPAASEALPTWMDEPMPAPQQQQSIPQTPTMPQMPATPQLPVAQQPQPSAPVNQQPQTPQVPMAGPPGFPPQAAPGKPPCFGRYAAGTQKCTMECMEDIECMAMSGQ